MNRRHARPMAAHRRAQHVRRWADGCADAVALALMIAAALAATVALYHPEALP